MNSDFFGEGGAAWPTHARERPTVASRLSVGRTLCHGRHTAVSYSIVRAALVEGPYDKVLTTQVAPASGVTEFEDTSAVGGQAFYQAFYQARAP